ncbi:ATP-binding protein [Paenibacillus mesophilus]|uniref:ATP-binding protein n=1 Tax=Paenibacillus mesophilus TaxID=2582849 RepID=UPI00110D4736|nr:ATP-binding protein [Paenibacillus mesophilus]TMV43144.1 ATP-binding protein [Paenibacillus mesophilus]
MTIISIEGASAVGKTSTSAELAASHGAFHIPEINTWWKERPNPEYREWWFERQADRWRIAQEKQENHSFVVIDIDLFQPFWYNWAYDFTLFDNQSLEFVADFYRKLLVDKKIGFPDRYYLLGCSEEELRKRKEADSSRRRGGFEMNLQFIKPQRHYFEAINKEVPGLVNFIDSVSINKNVKEILAAIPGTPSKHTYSIDLFDFIVDWLSRNKADQFR